MPTVVDLIQKSDRFNREDLYDFNLMIIGIPNVGKSTIINKMRNMYLGVGGRATTTGALPGVTRSVLERIKINANPPVYLFDTPGVLEPKIDKSVEVTMRCALCGQSLNRNQFSFSLLVNFFLSLI
jgi:ribosome biogenesis GTPase A